MLRQIRFGRTVVPEALTQRGAPWQCHKRALMCRAIVVAMPLGLVGGVSSAAASPPRLCVGGPRCYATVQAAVNAAPAGSTVRIGSGTFAGGVTIDGNVRLVGAGPGQTVIRGGGPVVTIGSATSTPSVTISGLTVTGGVSHGDHQSPNCGPDLHTCGPGYPTATGLGGGIEAFPGTNVTIENSVVTGNIAVPARTVTSVAATCAQNTMCQFSEGSGGGIDNWGTMTVIGSQVTDNRASGVDAYGGGIAVERNASLSLRDSAVSANKAISPSPDGRGASGGGIFVDDNGSLTVDGTAIDGNSLSLSNSIATPYPEGTGVTDNENSFGGGVDLAGSATGTVSNSELDHNSVSINTPLGQAYGGDPALIANSALTLQNVQVDHNTDTVNVYSSDANGVSGPSAFEADSNATITGVEVVGNQMTITTPHSDAAAVGAAGFFAGSVPATMSNSVVADNTATANAPSGMATVQGAGIINDSDLTLTNVLVGDNRAVANGLSGFAQGGGIWNGSIFGGPTPTLALDHSDVLGNTVSGSPGVTLQGGGIFTVGSPLTLTDSLVAHNTPDQCAGATC